MVDRLTEDAHATGAVNTITREGKRLIGHNTDVPGFKVALDKLVGKQKMPRQAVVLGRRRRRPRGGLRADHRRLPADHRLQPPSPPRRRPGQALRPERGPHGAPGDAVARVDHRGRAVQDHGCSSTRPRSGCTATSRRSRASSLPPDLLVLDLIYRRTRLLREPRRPGRPSPNGELMLLHQGAAAFTLWTGQPAPLELMQAQARPRRAPEGIESAEGEPTGAPADVGDRGRLTDRSTRRPTAMGASAS